MNRLSSESDILGKQLGSLVLVSLVVRRVPRAIQNVDVRSFYQQPPPTTLQFHRKTAEAKTGMITVLAEATRVNFGCG